MGMMGLMLIVLVVAGLLWPLVIVLPLCGFGAWVGVSLLIRAYRLRREGKKNEGSDPPAT